MFVCSLGPWLPTDSCLQVLAIRCGLFSPSIFPSIYLSVCIYIYVCIFIEIYTYTYIYGQKERETDKERNIDTDRFCVLVVESKAIVGLLMTVLWRGCRLPE